MVDRIKRHSEMLLSEKFEKFLGMSVEENSTSVKLHNACMKHRMMHFFNMTDTKFVLVPLPPGFSLVSPNRIFLSNYTPNRQLVGSLLHLANTVRADVFYVVNYLSRFLYRSTLLL